MVFALLSAELGNGASAAVAVQARAMAGRHMGCCTAMADYMVHEQLALAAGAVAVPILACRMAQES
jgi:hypothetical protein